ncbi:HD domain-containing protein [Nissabacter sp. SGAir0207]|uniref:HD domain-containing protein n=1 Tax=Nissabacter sp. SGAir0207 TaxID=2126321 RepID=UPI0010CD51D6|nr:HD domain-containing protein [Nissabacter sp. SGAir0207]QCR34647.1 GTP pyrophosphokinase [Nissabacter sp. SGAir0207]
MTTLVERARRFAGKAHAAINQRRKYTDDPYIVHPRAVAKIVRSVPHTEAMLAAAWLHDTVEDTPTTLHEIQEKFGAEVAELVEMLTNTSQPEEDSRIVRKNRDRRHTAQASPQAKTIKLADLIDNLHEILECDADFAKTYLIEKRLQLEVLKEGDSTLWQRAKRTIDEALDSLHQPPYNVPAQWFHDTERAYLNADRP